MAYNPQVSLSQTNGASASPAGATTGPQAVGIGPGFSLRYDPTNLATAATSTSTIDTNGANVITVGIETATTGTFIFEGTSDGINWFSVETFNASDDVWVSGQNLTPAIKTYHVLAGGTRRIRLRTVTTLGATVAHAVNATLSQQLIGAIDTGAAPHNFGYTTFHKDGFFTSAQTTLAFYTITVATKRFAITDITVTTGGTVAGTVTIYDAVTGTAYVAGTQNAIFRGEFAPSTASRPGALKTFTVPYVSSAAGNSVLLTTVGVINPLYIQINGYEF